LEVRPENFTLPNNVVYFNNGEDFERHLINNNYKEEIEETLKKLYGENLDEVIMNKHGALLKRQPTSEKCAACDQFIYEEVLRIYNTEEGKLEAYNDLLSAKKTMYPPILSQKIFDSIKPLPPKIDELIEKIDEILNPSLNVEN
jgi:chromosomal replication initiation ATPase DnaA